MRWLARLVVLLTLAAVGYLAWAWRSAFPEASVPAQSELDARIISKGADLVAIGNCAQCHTAAQGKPYAGGRAIETPFGVVWAPNITPDPDTGIGRYSKEAFARAMVEGVDRQGRHLYPAFPYDHMAKVSEKDIVAVWAFLMTRQPVRAKTAKTKLKFPYNYRLLLAGWKALFLDRRPFVIDPTKSAEWNRGAYLVEGLAHCGACHTPRNAFGAEIRSAAYSGGQVEGWSAPALNAASPAAVPWTAERLFAYLRHGRDDLHGVAAGPMNEVTHGLDAVPEADVLAIAIYVAGIAGNTTPERIAEGAKAVARAASKDAAGSPLSDAGVMIYAGACAQCHGETGRAPINPAINLALSSAVRAPNPSNLINIIRNGVRQPDGVAGPFMPGFADVLDETQLRQLAAFVRTSFSGRPAWSELADAVQRASASSK
jgi:mono/diheme cytochrome c family protein